MANRLSTRDPERDGLRRALRAAIIVPFAAAVSFLLGAEQSPVYTILGSFVLMVLADFPGNRPARALAYAWLGINGAVLITVGTLLAPHPWLSVILMFFLGVVVTFAGVLSETFAAGQRATLMLFVLPALTPPGPIAERLTGWLIALAICVPASLFLIAPRHHHELRRHAAQVCNTLADRLDGTASAADATAAMDALRADFLGADYRPVGLSAGSRALVRVVDDLQWITDRVRTGIALGTMREPAIRVLRAAARVLSISRPADRAPSRIELETAMAEGRTVAQGRYREDIVRLLDEADNQTAVEVGRALLTRRALGAAVAITGRVVLTAATADARPVWARVLGRQLPVAGASVRVLSDTTAVAKTTSQFVATKAVAVRNCLRTGFGLAAAVAITQVFPFQHGFWVVLGAMSVLRSSALTTGTKTVRAVIGTIIGFLIGAALIAILGVDPIVLWILLPVVVFLSAYVPEIASFTAAQAAFTMMVLIIFNLIAPIGWQVGLIRLEDVVVGALTGLVVSLLLWPRGAQAVVQAAVDRARAAGTQYLNAAVLRVTRGASEAIDDNVTALNHEALLASRVLDDAVRHYLSESGGVTDARAPVVRAFHQVIRLRSVAEVIADIQWPPPMTAYPRAKKILESHAEAVCDRLTGGTEQAWNPISDDLVPALRTESTGDDSAVSAALPLVTVAANLAELELTYPASTNRSAKDLQRGGPRRPGSGSG